MLLDNGTVTISIDLFSELVRKAACLDAIAESVRQKVDADAYSKVDDDVVLLLTGTMGYKKSEPEKTPENAEVQDEQNDDHRQSDP